MTTDHIGIFVTLIGILVSAIGGVGLYLFNQQNRRIDKLETTAKELKSECDIDIREIKETIMVEVRYYVQESMFPVRSEIANNKFLIISIENRLNERSNNAKEKWASIISTVNDIVQFLKSYGYMSGNAPLKGLDGTLSDVPNTNTLGD